MWKSKERQLSHQLHLAESKHISTIHPFIDKAEEAASLSKLAYAELQELLLTHPKVADVAVIGIHGSEVGELPKAFVIK
ncbi:putative 4-coumarate--CoA ligase 3 [Trichoplax sp. H2]|nr:putative 4-coumarate--CoA ligase 3 [Trichoplax sp. H2]|eukprot:RDD39446.1 putative 4-coumarate--CoA ligase 3 [Trichoplax sp. H2]